MNTVEFLRLVLPRKGLYISATPKTFNKNGETIHYFKHAVFNSIPELAAESKDLSDEGLNAYFACSSFADEFVWKEVAGEQKKKVRVQDNVLAVKTQWIDIDCGPGKEYETQKDGAAALVEFCKATGFPRPNLLVNSGNGIHGYWLFDVELTGDVWLKQAKLFKAVCDHFGFKVDPARTADSASVLRPIGTNNDKTQKGLGMKPVKLIGTANETPISFKGWLQQLIALKAEHNLSMPKEREKSKNSDLSGGTEYPPSLAELIAPKCQQIQFFRDYKGLNQEEPVWRACLGVLAFCDDGREKAHEWSSGHKDYNRANTDEKFDRRKESAGPTTCEHFKSCNPAGCQGCTRNCTSPIVLGRPEVQHQTEVEVQVEVVEPVTGEKTIETKIEELPEFPEAVLRKFAWDGNQLLVTKRVEGGAEGETQQIPVCSQLPVPLYTFFNTESNEWMWRVKCRVRPFVWREGDIRMSSFGQGGRTLLGELSSALTVIPKGTGNDLVEFMRTWTESLQAEQDDVNMYSHFGWYDDGSFLLGSTRYNPDGTTSAVRVSTELEKYVPGHTPTGDLKRYVELIDIAYNRPNHQMYQFTWLAGFASIFLRMAKGGSIGIPLAGWSRESGLGKSTVTLAAASVWGDIHAANQVAQANKATEYGIYAMAGMKRDLPVVIDETTLWEPARVAKFLYDFSDGRPKIQGQAKGGLRDNSNLQWSSFVMTSANRSVVDDMTSTIPDCAPQVARVLEYRFDTQHHETMSREEGDRVFDELFRHYAVAGDAFLRYVVPRREQIRDLIFKVRDQLAAKAGVDKDARFWLLGAACIWVAHMVTRKIEMQKFDGPALLEWIVDLISGMKGSASSARRDMGDLFGDMMTDLQSGFVVTDTEGDRRGGKAAQFAPGFGPPRGDVTGRVLLDKSLLYLSQTAVKRWCAEMGVSYREIELMLKDRGLLKAITKFSLGKGTAITVPQIKSLVIDAESFANKLTVVSEDNRKEGVA